jgi:uncharacterized protein YbcV (DUF1398 family)
MSKAIDNPDAAQKRAMAIRPKVGGFPYLAETPRRAGMTRNVWFLPACQSLFLTNDGPVVTQGRHRDCWQGSVSRRDVMMIRDKIGKSISASASS